MPFNDPSGDRLRGWLGLSRKEFYDEARVAIAAMSFCFPGQDVSGSDLPPRRECAPAWRARLFALMPQIELVLAVGQYAQAWHLPDHPKRSMTEIVSDWRTILASGSRPRILPLPHPSWRNYAWLKRHPWFETELLPMLSGEVARLVR
jgi:uracil-DNA glycosylase